MAHQAAIFSQLTGAIPADLQAWGKQQFEDGVNPTPDVGDVATDYLYEIDHASLYYCGTGCLPTPGGGPPAPGGDPDFWRA